MTADGVEGPPLLALHYCLIEPDHNPEHPTCGGYKSDKPEGRRADTWKEREESHHHHGKIVLKRLFSEVSRSTLIEAERSRGVYRDRDEQKAQERRRGSADRSVKLRPLLHRPLRNAARFEHATNRYTTIRFVRGQLLISR